LARAGSRTEAVQPEARNHDGIVRLPVQMTAFGEPLPDGREPVLPRRDAGFGRARASGRHQAIRPEVGLSGDQHHAERD
jgi:hypothetical protein